MPDGSATGCESVRVHYPRPPEIPRQRGGGADDEPSHARAPAHRVPARDRLDQALGLLEHMYALAIARAGMGNLVEIQTLRAPAPAAAWEHTAAVAALAGALALAHHPHGYIRITELSTALGVPLDYHAAHNPAGDTTHAEPHLERGAAAAMPVMIEPLTARELEVLALLAAGWSNRRIATALVVTLHTVKKHVGHILDKLGAANRTEAAARARLLGLTSVLASA